MMHSVGHLETRFGEGKMALETTTCRQVEGMPEHVRNFVIGRPQIV
jgi:hypothetical protein